MSRVKRCATMADVLDEIEEKSDAVARQELEGLLFAVGRGLARPMTDAENDRLNTLRRRFKL